MTDPAAAAREVYAEAFDRLATDVQLLVYAGRFAEAKHAAAAADLARRAWLTEWDPEDMDAATIARRIGAQL
jgi:hypothetical protein